ncbi:unnamed protein product [Timema podura]|uniref:Uncharacterized protein n=1 Tax=Timema podura TaxID=61482 RepID=A0ABN7NZN7_TIMPD|nr:unnamed protein product [Timema podura]
MLYNPAVLVGNWFEEQKKYIPNRLQHSSTYHIDFQSPNHILEPDNNFVPDKCIQNEGLGSELLLPYSNRYRSNYTSSSDLHYNHAVRFKEKTRPRHYNPRFDQWRPQQDWTCGYGNLTHFGLLENKEEKWHKDVSKDIKTTEYRETYLPPLAESYTSTRAAVPKHVFYKVDNHVGVAPQEPGYTEFCDFGAYLPQSKSDGSTVLQ